MVYDVVAFVLHTSHFVEWPSPDSVVRSVHLQLSTSYVCSSVSDILGGLLGGDGTLLLFSVLWVSVGWPVHFAGPMVIFFSHVPFGRFLHLAFIVTFFLCIHYFPHCWQFISPSWHIVVGILSACSWSDHGHENSFVVTMITLGYVVGFAFGNSPLVTGFWHFLHFSPFIRNMRSQ